mgnify:CR=1 FL=1
MGQCNSCDVTIDNNGANTNTPTNLKDGDVICINANNRTRSIDLRNKNNLTICVGPGDFFSGNLDNYNTSNKITINVYGEYRGNLTLNNSSSSFNVFSSGIYTNNGSLSVQNGSVNNSGTINRGITFSNSSSFNNSGLQTGNITINGAADVRNSGIMNISSLSFDNNNSGMSFTNFSTGTLNVSNSVTMSGKIVLNGTSTFQNNLTFINNNSVKTVTIDGSASLTVNQTLSLSRNTIINITNPSNLTPKTSLTVNSLDFQNNGGSNSTINQGANTIFNVTNNTNVQSGVAQLNIEGAFDTGNNFTVGNNGNASPVRLQLKGDGQLSIGGNASISKHITAEDNSKIDVAGNLIMENNGDNSFTIDDNVTLHVGQNTTLNKPMYVSGSSKITLDGNLTMPNVGSELVINDDVNFYVGGNTSVESPIRMNDNSFVTFDGNVNLPNVGNAIFEVNDNSDVLITSNLTKSGGNVSVGGTGQLVICDQRLPTGSVSGSYPAAGSSGVSAGANPAYYGGCRILPVDYLYFKATYQSANRKTLLEWSTAQEWGNSHFEVERAINSIKEWEVIARVDGNGYSNEPATYTYTDDQLPLAGGDVFYRLKQVDDDASFSYSKTEAIQLPSLAGKSVWVAFPNPISYGTEISVSLIQPDLYQDEPIYISLINMLGEGESKVLTYPEEVSRMVSEWMRYKNAGLYIMDIRWGNNSEQIKLLKN